VLPATGAPFTEALQTTRVDGGIVAQTLVAGRYVLTARGSVTNQHHDHVFGDVREIDQDDTLFGEVALRGTTGSHTWVAGGAFERHTFDPQGLPRFAYQYNVPALFAQDDVIVRPWLSVSASGRVDVHNAFGTFVSPRVSMLVRDGGWSARASVGTGFFAPTPLTEETQAAGLSHLTISAPLEPEQGRSASVDLTRRAGPLSVTVSGFDSSIRDPVVLDRDHYVLRNLPTATTNFGGELLAVWHQEPLHVRAFQ
jgi:iron complex outermembrane receptor protein